MPLIHKVAATPVGEVRVANHTGQGQQRGQPLIVLFSKSLCNLRSPKDRSCHLAELLFMLYLQKTLQSLPEVFCFGHGGEIQIF